jgi:hypothetical protein
MGKRIEIIYEFDNDNEAQIFFNRVHDLIATNYFGKISPNITTKEVK